MVCLYMDKMTLPTTSVVAGYQAPQATKQCITLPARPEQIAFSPSETAIIVVDMQNAFASAGGYLDLAGFDISGAKDTTENVKKTLDAARASGIQILYFQTGFDSEYTEIGAYGSPNWYKSHALRMMRARPELRGQLLARGTWDHEIVDELKPHPGDIVVPKNRYSGFFNASVDSILRSRGIRNLVFTGIATNVCVESSLRDAFHLEYFCVLLEDATKSNGPEFMQKAVVFNVEKFFGWVASVKDFCSVLGHPDVALPAA
jgi:ureidoacrylate peracid hydrolase